MNKAMRGVLASLALAGALWILLGTWQIFVVATLGAICAWLFTTPPPFRSLGVRIDTGDLRVECFDYGGCKWAGDGCKGKPVVLGPGDGCVHTGARNAAYLVVGSRAPERQHRYGCVKRDCQGCISPGLAVGKRCLDEACSQLDLRKEERKFGTYWHKGDCVAMHCTGECLRP
jgi:hypothetical protein